MQPCGLRQELTFFLPQLVIAAIGCVMIASCVMLHWNNEGQNRGVRSKALGLVFITMVDLNLAAYSIILSLLGQNIAGTTKKQTAMVITFVFCEYCPSIGRWPTPSLLWTSAFVAVLTPISSQTASPTFASRSPFSLASNPTTKPA